MRSLISRTVIKSAFLISAIFLFTSQVSASDYVVGADGGSVSVGNSGQAVWSMPIEVPSGVNGLAPSINLGVASSGGNGSLGLGGSLSGLSVISRCGKTHYQDGYHEAPQYTKNDAYCIDGQRLRLESGTYGASGSVYRTEIESYQRIKAFGSVNGTGPEYFKVTNRAGASLYYGLSAGRKTFEIDPVTGARTVWKIDKLQDIHKNELIYTYENVGDSNEVQLTQIAYGRNASKNTPFNLFVDFIYKYRPDSSRAWRRGQQVAQTRRIGTIQSRVGDEVVKEYRISYQKGAVSGASRIASIQLCAGTGDCYKPSVFEYAAERRTVWNSSDATLKRALQTADGKPLGTLADINNDGLTDWIVAHKTPGGSNIIQTYLGQGTGSQHTWKWSTPLRLPGVLYDYNAHADGLVQGMLLDVNGDGWPDYVQAYQTATQTVLKTWRNTGDGFVEDASLKFPTALTRLDNQGAPYSLADIDDLNADGLLDVIQSVKLSNGSTVKKTWLQQVNNGQHSWQLSNAFTAPSLSTDYTQGGSLPNSQIKRGEVYALLQDMNGDGLSDWVKSYRKGGQTYQQTWLNTGRGWRAVGQFNTPVASINYDLVSGEGVVEYAFSDINGDGLVDLVKAYTSQGTFKADTRINTGYGWSQDTRFNLPAAMMNIASTGKTATLGGLLDLNSDGQPDFVQSYEIDGSEVARFWLYDTKNNQWQSTNEYDLPLINNTVLADGGSVSLMQIADLNNDGYPELFSSVDGQANNLFTAKPSDAEHFPGTLIGTETPLGAQTKLEYAMSTDRAVYEPAPISVYPNIAYNAPVRVVSNIRASNSVGGWVNALHQYGKAKANVRGIGGLGYAYHTIKDGASGVEVSTQFHQTYPYAGRMKASSKKRNGVTFSSSDSEVLLKDIAINGLTTTYIHPNKSTSENYDDQGRLLTSTETVSYVDNYGNATSTTEKIRDSQGVLQRRVTKEVEYDNKLGPWILGLPTSNTVTTVSPVTNETFVNKSSASFDYKGRAKSEVLEPGHAQAVTKTYLYDDFGNRTSSTVSATGIQSRTSSTMFTADGRFPVEVINPLGHKLTSVFDPLISKPLKVTDANGISKEYVYDAFGTVLKETKAHQSTGATRGRQIVMPRWCDDPKYSAQINCPTNAVYFVAAFDDEGEAPEIAFYNANGKELRKQTYGFDGKIIAVDMEYDAQDRVLKASQPYFKDEETATWTTYTYDHLGRQIKRVNPEGSVFNTAYDGLLVSTTNPGNNDTAAQTSTIENNIFGQPIMSEDAAGSVTRYEYDGRGKLVKTIDAKNNIATISYDPIFGRKVAMNDPDLGVWQYEYDALGNLIKQTDAKQQVTTMEYDLLNRLVRRVDDATGKADVTNWTYYEKDQDGNVEAGGIIGGLKQVTSPNYQRTLEYDHYSRVVKANTQIDGQLFTQRTGYQGTADKVDWQQYPTGITVRNTYDDYGFPNTVEGITLNLAKYDEFQTEAERLNELQRALEQWKNQNLSETELAQLEEHEKEVRRLGKLLGEFYEQFEQDPLKQQADQVSQHYQGLAEQVEKQLSKHGNWLTIYSNRYDALASKHKTRFDRLDELSDAIRPDRIIYDEAKEQFDIHAANAKPYEIKINERSERYQSDVAAVQRNINSEVNNLKFIIGHILKDQYQKLWQDNWEEFLKRVAGEDGHRNFFDEFEYQLDLDTLGHENDVNYWIGNIDSSGNVVTEGQLMKSIRKLGEYGAQLESLEDAYKAAIAPWKKEFDKHNNLAKPYADTMQAAATSMKPYTDEMAQINNIVAADLRRMNDWLSPIIGSHNNVLLGFNDRARSYGYKVSEQSGSYARRTDLQVDEFLGSFTRHYAYVRCLRYEAGKTTGQCYAENLVVDEDPEKQTEAREKIGKKQTVDVKNFWQTRRFFCPSYYGYSCPNSYQEEILQLAKNIHHAQCARVEYPDEYADLVDDKKALPCEQAQITQEDYQEAHYPYLYGTRQSNLSVMETDIIQRHKTRIEDMVCSANEGTYNAECDSFDNITRMVLSGDNTISAGHRECRYLGQLRCQTASQEQANNEQQAESDQQALELGELPSGQSFDELFSQAQASQQRAAEQVKPEDFVLIYRGEVQRLAATRMANFIPEGSNNIVNISQVAEQLLIAEEGVKAVLGTQAYEDYYYIVQEQNRLIDELYQAVDQAYASADDKELYEKNKKIYWQAEDVNAQGQIKQAKYGNGLITEWNYDQFGRIVSHATQTSNAASVVNYTYQYDALGNLSKREDLVQDIREDYQYDIMNRLTRNTLSGTGAALVRKLNRNITDYSYDELGNITKKSDIAGCNYEGCYKYGDYEGKQAGPHAVSFVKGLGKFTYDANGNQLTGHGRTNIYSPFNKPTKIYKGGTVTRMEYGPERQLIKKTEPSQNGEQTTTYVGGAYEQIKTAGQGIVHRHQITVAGQPIAVVETQGSLQTDSAQQLQTVTKEHYLHKNHQSSVIAITDQYGQVVERRHYDPFGDIKNGLGKTAEYVAGLAFNPITDLSFTGHKFLAAAGIIHMRGRVYDAVLGRFLSADPHIQSPLNSQSLNRYSYVWNNPLSFTDPSGYFLSSIFKSIKKLFDKIKKIIKAVVKAIKKIVKVIAKAVRSIGRFIKKYARVIVAVVVAVAIVYFTAGAGAGYAGAVQASIGTKVAAGALAGAASGLIMTGSIKGMLEGAFFGAVTAGFAAKVTAGAKVVTDTATGLSKTVLSAAQKTKLVLGHAVIGGARAVVNGGKFLTGFLSAGLGKLATFGTNLLAGDGFSDKLIQGLAVATVGGAISALAGGSFELGFIMAGLAFAVNQIANEMGQKIVKSASNFDGDDRFLPESDFRGCGGLPKCNLFVDHVLENTEGVTDPYSPNPTYPGPKFTPTAMEWAATDDQQINNHFEAAGWEVVNDGFKPGDVISDGAHMGIYAGKNELGIDLMWQASINKPVNLQTLKPSSMLNYYGRRFVGN